MKYCLIRLHHINGFFSGECVHSSLVGVSDVRNANECLGFCQGIRFCSHFTFLEHDGACLAYSECVELDTTCMDCTSGDSTCNEQFMGCNERVSKTLAESHVLPKGFFTECNMHMLTSIHMYISVCDENHITCSDILKLQYLQSCSSTCLGPNWWCIWGHCWLCWHGCLHWSLLLQPGVWILDLLSPKQFLHYVLRLSPIGAQYECCIR